jgi:hypothetical protein
MAAWRAGKYIFMLLFTSCSFSKNAKFKNWDFKNLNLQKRFWNNKNNINLASQK